MSKWISLNEKLPIELSDMEGQTFKTVTVIVSYGDSVAVCEYMAGNTIEYWSQFNDSFLPPITHWQPLPAPYKAAS